MPKYLFRNHETNDYLVIRAPNVGRLPHPLVVPYLDLLESSEILQDGVVIGERPTPEWDAYKMLDLYESEDT